MLYVFLIRSLLKAIDKKQKSYCRLFFYSSGNETRLFVRKLTFFLTFRNWPLSSSDTLIINNKSFVQTNICLVELHLLEFSAFLRHMVKFVRLIYVYSVFIILFYRICICEGQTIASLHTNFHLQLIDEEADNFTELQKEIEAQLESNSKKRKPAKCK